MNECPCGCWRHPNFAHVDFDVPVEPRILTSVGLIEAPVLGSERTPCPGCAEPCGQCDQEALD